MKKIALMFAMAAVSLSAAASDWYAGGSFGFWRNATDNETTFNIMPEVGYNLDNKMSVGVTFGFEHEYTRGHSLNLGCINPYVRYKFYKNEKVDLFCDGGVDLGFGRAKYKGAESDAAFTYAIGLRPGIAYNISKDFSLVAHVGYLGYKGGNKASGAPDQGGLGLNLNEINFGFYYNF